jgi:hypothetical protein
MQEFLSSNLTKNLHEITQVLACTCKFTQVSCKFTRDLTNTCKNLREIMQVHAWPFEILTWKCRNSCSYKYHTSTDDYLNLSLVFQLFVLTNQMKLWATFRKNFNLTMDHWNLYLWFAVTSWLIKSEQKNSDNFFYKSTNI